MVKENIDKWYNNATIVDTLLFILPPVGVYGLYKTERLKSSISKVFYGFLGFTSLLITIIYLT